MGGGSSALTKEYMEVLQTLTQEDCHKDKSFLAKLLSAAPNRADAPPVDPSVLNQIATLKPANFQALLVECIKFLELLSDSNNAEDVPNTVHNQISLVLQIFTTSVTVVTRNPHLRKLFIELVSPPGALINDSTEEKPKKGNKAAKDKRPKAEDDEDDSEEEKPLKKKKSSKPQKETKRGKRQQEESSDDEDSEEEKPKKRGKKSETEEKPKRKGKKAEEAVATKKKGRKEEVEDDDDDDEEPEEPKKRGKKSSTKEEAVEEKRSKKNSKKPEPEEKPSKKRGKKVQEEDEEESEEEKPKKSRRNAKEENDKAAKKKGKKVVEDDDEDDEEEKPKRKGKRSAKEEVAEEKPSKRRGKKVVEDDDDDDDEEEKPKRKGKKSSKEEVAEEKPTKKKGKKGQDDEEEKPKRKGKKSSKEEVVEEKPTKKKGKKVVDDDDSEEEKPKKKGKKVVDDDDSEEEKPKKKGKKLIVEESEDSEADNNHSRRNDLSMLSRFMSCIFKFMFKKNITGTTKQNLWEPANIEHESIALTRYDLVHSIIALTNLSVISQPQKPLPRYTITVPSFHSALFLESLCQIASDFVVEFNTGTITVYSAEMIKNCFALVADFATKDNFFMKGFNGIPAAKAIAAFTGYPIQKELIFDPTSAFSSASLSFLYMMALNNKNFVKVLAKEGLSNRFVFDLIYTMQFSFEKVGVCYVHSILISTLMLILADEKASKDLMQIQNQRLLVNFKPHSTTYADLLIEIVLNLSGNESLLPSIVCLYHLISANIKEISMNATFKLLTLFEKVSKACLEHKTEKNRRLVEIFMEGFVRNMIQGVNIRVLLIQKASIFRALVDDDDLEFNDSLNAIIEFLDEAKTRMSKAGKKTMGTPEAIEFFKSLDIEELFEYYDIDFDNHPHIFSGEMKKTWSEWADMLALKSYETEANLLKAVTF